jgi:hypothetical protein
MTVTKLAGWQEVGSPIPTALEDVRLQLHWAAQVVGAVGHTFATPADDDSHTALTWHPRFQMMMGTPVGTVGPVRAALAPGRFLLRLVALDDGSVIDEFPLGGATLDEAYHWMADALHSATGTLTGPLRRRDYDMPGHPVGDGAPFDGDDRRAAMEVSRWFGNGFLVLQHARESWPGAAPVRIWPHHFDIGTVFPVESGREPGASVGVGLSPGDATFGEPYWYANVWPAPARVALPPLGGKGRWHTEGWTGAILLGTDCALAGRGPAQEARVLEFLASAVPAASTLLEAH